MIDSMRDAIRRDRLDGAKIKELAKKYHLCCRRISEVIRDLPRDPKTLKILISNKITDDPDMPDQQIADAIGCSVEMVAERRSLRADGKVRVSDHMLGRADDGADKGRRISATWMRQHCSRGQRDIRQVQALFGTERITLNEVRASAISAGLKVHRSTGVIGERPVDRPTETVVRECRVKVGSLGTRRTRY